MVKQDEFIIDSENCDLYGCMDETACNYDGSTLFSSSCTYPQSTMIV